MKRDLLESGDAQATALRNGLDHAKDESDMSALLELSARDAIHVARLRLALEKLHRGTYGDCELCDEPIDIRRMTAQPTAVLCFRCQSRAERRGVFEAPSRRLPRGTGFDLIFSPARYGSS